jgi:hypothetical protein
MADRRFPRTMIERRANRGACLGLAQAVECRTRAELHLSFLKCESGVAELTRRIEQLRVAPTFIGTTRKEIERSLRKRRSQPD